MRSADRSAWPNRWVCWDPAHSRSGIPQDMTSDQYVHYSDHLYDIVATGVTTITG